MGDAVLADPQGHEQLPVDSVRLNEAFNNALDMDATSLWPETRWPGELESVVDARMTEQNKRKYEEVEWDVAPRQVKFPRHEQSNGTGNAFLADRQGQTPLATGVWHNAAHNIASHHEMTPGRCIAQDEELACRAAVAELGSQTPGVAVNGVTLRNPQIKLPSDNHGAAASGSHLKKILNEVSAGTSLMAACKAAYCIR
jgi:hypothetical protein